jgi:FliI/YscN family ATPase
MERLSSVRREGIVRAASKSGVVLKVALPDARLGERCEIVVTPDRAVPAEVVGFCDDLAQVMPFGSLAGLCEGARVVPVEDDDGVPVGPDVRGCVLDASGRLLERVGTGSYRPLRRPLDAAPPDALRRPVVRERLVTGIKSIDALFPLGKGQRVGVFAGAGVGKSTLLGMLTRYFRDPTLAPPGSEAARAVENRSVVVALIGERRREVREYLEDALGPARAQATVVVSTSDEPPLMRLRAAHVATAIAEYERDQGRDVLLLMDSVTRFARAVRDLGLALEEAPGRGGFPPSVFAELPRLFERAGTSERGSITAIYTVLMDSADGTLDVVAEEVKSLLDGHIYLRPQADRVRWRPGVDVLDSVSRVADAVVDAECSSRQEADRRRARMCAAVDVVRTAYEFRRNPEDLKRAEGMETFNRRLKAISGRAMNGATDPGLESLLVQDKAGPPVPLARTLQLLDAACAGICT